MCDVFLSQMRGFDAPSFPDHDDGNVDGVDGDGGDGDDDVDGDHLPPLLALIRLLPPFLRQGRWLSWMEEG